MVKLCEIFTDLMLAFNLADDCKILSLFREWVSAKRLSWAVPDDKEDEFEAAAAVADKREDAIIATPSSGAAGFAIKAYLLLQLENKHDEDGAALGDKLNWQTLEASILGDVIRFVPELAPLVAAAIRTQPDKHRPFADGQRVDGLARVPGTDSSQTHRWRGVDSNFRFREREV